MSAVMKQDEFKGLVDQPAKNTQTDNDLGRVAGRLLLPAQAMGLRWSIGLETQQRYSFPWSRISSGCLPVSQQ